MSNVDLYNVAAKMMTPGKGILAADESIGTATKRLEDIGVESSAATRRQYRDLFLSTQNIEKYLSAVILFEETLTQYASDGTPFPLLLQSKGIIPGIKVDLSTYEMPGFPGEALTRGLDDLPDRLRVFKQYRNKFAKWRAVIHIGEDIPTAENIHTNAIHLSLYARIAQDHGFVPIVEPEVLMKGKHTVDRAEEVTRQVLDEVMYQLERFRVDLPGAILKTSMVIAGSKSNEEVSSDEVAMRTVRVLKETVPDNLGGVVFLSGGQEPQEAASNLSAIAQEEPLPWEITFSYGRALQQPALQVWEGKESQLSEARETFLATLKRNVKADRGKLWVSN